MTFESLKLVLKHEGDWTQGTEFFPDITIYSLGYVLNRNGKNIEYMRFADKYGNLKNLTLNLSKDFFIQVIRKNNNGNGEMILIGDYEGSIRKVMNSLGMISLGLTVKKGTEIYISYFDNTLASKKEIINVLTDYCDVLEISRINKTRIDCLTDEEERILKIALENGFFDNPRKITLYEISKIFKASKSTVDYRLKNAIRKILIEKESLTEGG